MYMNSKSIVNYNCMLVIELVHILIENGPGMSKFYISIDYAWK